MKKLLIVLALATASCATPKYYQVEELPAEFTHKCGDCRDLKESH